MNSMEKYQKALSLEPFADRTEIPVFPLMITTFPAFAGITQAEAYNDIHKWLEAAEKTFEIIGKPDIMSASYPQNTVFNMFLPSRVPGRELGENELYQFVESPYFDDPAEYGRIMQMGYGNWFAEHTMAVQTPPMTSFEELGARFGRSGMEMGIGAEFVYRNGMVPWFDNATYPIFDALSMYRSMQDFLFDLIDDPGPIMDVVNTFTPEEIDRIIGQTKANNGWRVSLFAMRSSSTFISPDMFDEYAWPALKSMIEAFHAAGMHSIIHADANWLPMLEYFTQVPRGSVHIELDGATDIFKAYDILQGWQCIQGDVPATMLMMDSPDDVSAYCEKLIQMGMKGGFILGSGCEVPMNAKPENVAALIASVR